MQPVEQVNKIFIAKLFLLFGLLYLGFVLEVPQFVKASEKKPKGGSYASPAHEEEPMLIKNLYYQLVSGELPDKEEVSI
ncbi:hypothetical protein [Pontibacter burrus]|uniref:Uncharacterized protein n=1 Tax=Pontibacter burrus TaxID=2704466 RepID=A0A6B3LNH1_9BACT|nr:hypothetical protein [Pontibacter burrus]NEM98329.1 hypothetical protein [Pontibacter burrus]